MSFDTAVAFTLGIEGGLADMAGDRGGLTKYGISHAQYPDLDIANLTLDAAKAIYLVDYWVKAGCPEQPDKLATCTFDAVVNHGVAAGVKLLQRAASAVPIDGQWGPNTKLAVDHAVALYGEDSVVEDLLTRREILYERIVQFDPTQARFLSGWKARLTKLKAEVCVA